MPLKCQNIKAPEFVSSSLQWGPSCWERTSASRSGSGEGLACGSKAQRFQVGNLSPYGWWTTSVEAWEHGRILASLRDAALVVKESGGIAALNPRLRSGFPTVWHPYGMAGAWIVIRRGIPSRWQLGWWGCVRCLGHELGSDLSFALRKEWHCFGALRVVVGCRADGKDLECSDVSELCFGATCRSETKRCRALPQSRVALWTRFQGFCLIVTMRPERALLSSASVMAMERAAWVAVTRSGGRPFLMQSTR